METMSNKIAEMAINQSKKVIDTLEEDEWALLIQK